MGKAASAQRSPPHTTELAPTLTVMQIKKIIRAPALRVDTPNSLDNPIREATLCNQADLGIQVITPNSQVEATITSFQHGAPRTVMVVMEVDT